MEKRRTCTDIITLMLNEVPSSETEFIEALKWNYEDASYKPPEETIQWGRTMETLMDFIPNPSEEWEFKVLSIFTTKSIEDLKRMANENKEHKS